MENNKKQQFINAVMDYEEKGREQDVILTENEWNEITELVYNYNLEFGKVEDWEVDSYWLGLEREATEKANELYSAKREFKFIKEAEKYLENNAFGIENEETELSQEAVDLIEKSNMFKIKYFNYFEFDECVNEWYFNLTEIKGVNPLKGEN